MDKIPNLSNTEYEIMKLLRSREMYGLEMIRACPSLKRGTIYVTLDRMTDKGFLTSRAVHNPNEAGMPRRLYSATALGQRVLHARDVAGAAFASGAFA
ncbi:MAG: PadR family transcriptional regulator [Mesorhizobium sp.]|uniref:PadR family transcriptional regulator n=1 Tax=Mesorhizobium sp. TaxID=1871066 RepID=UPI000FE5EEDB|nr:PadR family transcriptional regulator [Mesorhizobium sp.]RWL81898.1 MAG: PadR family transcriptional regulator [Mesorhizobium sp.]RWL82286.1 MAG: PadR family transcriptional regulator [Mesorhizobium sp.]RWL98649.1 MAG: PadR family transcriptional regulator [Mesorhizobium sp.]